MRDELNGDLAGIRATDDDRFGAQPGDGRGVEPPLVRAVREPTPRRQRNGALWAICLSLLIALIGLGYWSHEQQSRLQRQLVATQESFARISEEAAGRLQDISGKVTATESTLSQSERQRIEQLSKLEQAVAQLTAAQQTQQQTLEQQQKNARAEQQRLQQQLQQAAAAREQELTALQQRTEALAEQLQRQQQEGAELREQLAAASSARDSLNAELLELQQQVQGLAGLEQQLAEQGTQLARQRGELQALMEAARPSAQQEMLALRGELDQRLDSLDEAVQAIDSFRVQANRNISTLQNQLGNLQQQLDQR